MAPRKSGRKKLGKVGARKGGEEVMSETRDEDDTLEVTAPAPDQPDEDPPPIPPAHHSAPASSPPDTSATALGPKNRDLVGLRKETDDKIQAYKSPFGPPPVAARLPVTTVGEAVTQGNPPLEQIPETVAKPKRKYNKRKRAATPSKDEIDEPSAKRSAVSNPSLHVADDVRPKPSKTYSRKRQEALAGDQDVGNVETLPLAGVASLTCTFKDEAGSLILSVDKSVLQFFGLDQRPPEVPRFSLLISELSKKPMTSARKSKPMCIRIKGNNDERGVDNAFAVPQTDEGYAAMHEMRENIVAALLHAAFKTQVNEEDLGTTAKPYKCEKCEKTFRNKNGLEYHVLKSQTICNPKFDPSLVTPKKQIGGVKKGVKPKVPAADLDFDSQGESLKVPIPDQNNDAPMVNDGVPIDNQAEDSSTSEDSVIAWGWKHSGRAPRRAARRRGDGEAQDELSKGLSDSYFSDHAPKKAARKKHVPAVPKSKKRYKAYHGEVPFLEEVAEELSNQQNDQVREAGGDAVIDPLDNELTPEACEKVFIELVASKDGIFPGDRSMWFALVAVWLERYKTSKSLPESKLCSRILDGLVESGKLRKLEFSFRDSKSRDIIRSVYTSLDYDEKDESFAETKEAMKAAHPGFYVPVGYAPPAPVLQQLEKLVRGGTRAMPAETQRDINSLEVDHEEGDGDFRTEETDSAQDDTFLHENMNTTEDEFDIEDEVPNLSKNAKISKSVKKWHAERRAAGLAPPLSRRSLRKESGFSSPAKRRGPSQDEKNKRYARETSQPFWGASAITWIPNPMSGAWDSQPVRLRVPLTATSSKPRGIGSGFAEPITFMQAEDGAWSERPFGHGVKPIFARPTRRVEGSHNQQAYLEKLENGFRPLLYPAKRKFGPAPASKRLLRENDGAVRKPRKTTIIPSAYQTVDEDFTTDPSFTPQDADSDLDFEVQTPRENDIRGLIPSPAPLSKKRGRNSNRLASNLNSELNEIEILNYIEPKKLQPGSIQNPGLSTLPPEFYGSITQSNRADHEAEFSPSRILFPEPGNATESSEFQNGSWISSQPGRQKRTYNKIRFDEQTAFTVDTLPYDKLDDQSEEENLPKRQKIHSSSIELIQLKGKGKVARTKKLIPTRPLTALPIDLDGILEDPLKIAEYLGVEIVKPLENQDSRKRTRMGNRMSKAEESRFIVTVIIVRTLTGGIDQYIDWVIVSTLFPNFSLTHLNKCWVLAYKNKQELIDELVVDFQDAFLVAYRDGVIKPIDFDNLLQYDWARLLKWTMKNVDTSLTPSAVKLPADRRSLKEDYIYNEVTRETSEAQQMYFGVAQPIYRRLDAVASSQLAIPVNRAIEADRDESISQLTIAKSYARASALTPIETWDWSIAKNKLTEFGSELLEEAIETLKEEKVIIKRNKAKSTTGRIYEASDAFAASLRKPIASDTFFEAFQYKEFLDAEFRNGNKNLLVDYMGNEGSYMCLSSLQAAGRIKLTGLNLPMDKMGLGDDAHPYDTKRIPKSKVKWDMDISPTTSYVYNDENTKLQSIFTTDAPTSPSGAIPAWNGIGDLVIPDLWVRILCAVCSTIALRSGISKRALRVVFQPTLEDWEISLFLQWGQEKGILQREDEEVDGWSACEDWWLLVGGIVKAVEQLDRGQKDEWLEKGKVANGGKRRGKVKGKLVEGEDAAFESP